MQLNANSMADVVVREVAAVQATGGGEIGIAAAAPADFCGIWAKAKPILQFLAGIAILIPGLGATAGGVLTALIKIGDQIAAEMCS